MWRRGETKLNSQEQRDIFTNCRQRDHFRFWTKLETTKKQSSDSCLFFFYNGEAESHKSTFEMALVTRMGQKEKCVNGDDEQ